MTRSEEIEQPHAPGGFCMSTEEGEGGAAQAMLTLDAIAIDFQ